MRGLKYDELNRSEWLAISVFAAYLATWLFLRPDSFMGWLAAPFVALLFPFFAWPIGTLCSAGAVVFVIYTWAKVDKKLLWVLPLLVFVLIAVNSYLVASFVSALANTLGHS